MKTNIWMLLSLVLFGLIFGLAVVACNYPTQTPPTSTPDILPTLVATLLATSQPTLTPDKPIRLLTICLGEEPTSLFPYGDASPAARAIREAIYDNPIDWVNYEPHTGILEKIPNSADGSVRLEPVSVSPGDLILDSNGQIATLKEGSTYFPIGCRESGCSLTYTGAEPVQMDQLVVKFTLREGIQWSNQNPIRASDSVFSYETARQLYPRYRPELLRTTTSYNVLDDRTLEWRGIPGYIDPSFTNNFFLPFPEQLWGNIPVDEMSTADLSSRLPVGWGPYIIEDWKSGDHLTLRKNESYFRSGDGLPAFDRLVFRFVGGSPEGLAALLAGECDILDAQALKGANQEELERLQDAGKILITLQPDTSWEQLLFNVQPLDASQPALLQRKEVRQSIAYCIDRQSLQNRLGVAQKEINSYVQPGNPLYNVDSRKTNYDPQLAVQGLEAAGWLDTDNDPSTPRVSAGADAVPDGTAFTLELVSLDDSSHTLVAESIKENLSQCGIQINIRYLTPQEMFAPGPDGHIFGRKFQLALIGWNFSIEPACSLYTTDEIPGPPPGAYKGWGGANAGGYSNAEFDQTCTQARASLPDNPSHADSHRKAQSIFAEELPALPLFTHSNLIASRPDLCGLAIDSSSQDPFWNLEELNYGEECPNQ